MNLALSVLVIGIFLIYISVIVSSFYYMIESYKNFKVYKDNGFLVISALFLIVGVAGIAHIVVSLLYNIPS